MRRIRKANLFVVLAVVGVLVTPAHAAATSWSWLDAVLQPPRSDPAVVAFGKRVYVMGGWTGSDRVTSGAYYDVTEGGQGAWHPMSPYPGMARQGVGIAAVKGKIYMVGGWGWDGTKWVDVADLDRYDPVTDTWKILAPIPTPIDKVAAAGSADGRLYVFGGNVGDPAGFSGVTASTYIYNTATNRWTTGATDPVRSMGAAAAFYKGKAYVIGGWNSDLGDLNTVMRYAPRTNAWKRMTPMHVSRSAPGWCRSVLTDASMRSGGSTGRSASGRGT